jgi:LPS sulfotransferase NodH
VNQIAALFNNTTINLDRLQTIEAIQEPRSRYIIAITPRSGSSYLCDMMTGTKLFGKPQEALDSSNLKNHLKINIPGRTPEEYIRNLIRVRRTANNVSGLKASWFQFQNFMTAMNDTLYLSGFKYIYLTRRNLTEQAVSLYKATASSVFHTNKEHSADALKQLDQLEYDYKAIKDWYDHIVAQEKGWQDYFYKQRIFPLCISYEEIEEDVFTVLKRIAIYISVSPENIVMPEFSAFKKVSDERNLEWSLRFSLEQNGIEYPDRKGLRQLLSNPFKK